MFFELGTTGVPTRLTNIELVTCDKTSRVLVSLGRYVNVTADFLSELGCQAESCISQPLFRPLDSYSAHLLSTLVPHNSLRLLVGWVSVESISRV